MRIPPYATAVLLAGALAAGAHAEEVKIPHGELQLNANLEQAEGKALDAGVIVLTHGTLAHNGMEIIATLQNLLKEQGFNTLAVNLGLGLDDRHGMYDCATPHTHRHTDAPEEIAAWLAWLKQQGAGKVVLLGHSRGGNQTAWFAAEHAGDPAIKGLALIAPATWEQAAGEQEYQEKYGQALPELLKTAQAAQAAGKGAEPMPFPGFLYCEQAQATPDAFVSYYAPDPRRDTPHLLQTAQYPTLVVAGSEDEVVKGLIDKVTPLQAAGKLRLHVVDGADHYFRDLYAEDAAGAVAEFAAPLLGE